MRGKVGRLKLALDTGEQVVVGVAEGAHAFALELSGDGVEVDAGVVRTAEGCLGRDHEGSDGVGHVAVVRKGPQRSLGHRVDHVRRDQLLDVQSIE